MEIIKKCFITLVSSFLLVGILVLILTGNTLDIKNLISVYQNNNESFNIYDKLVKSIEGDNYETLNNFTKSFYFTSKYISTLAIVDVVNNVPFLNLIATFLNIMILISSGFIMIIEILLKIISFGLVIIYTIVNYMTLLSSI